MSVNESGAGESGSVPTVLLVIRTMLPVRFTGHFLSKTAAVRLTEDRGLQHLFTPLSETGRGRVFRGARLSVVETVVLGG